MLGFFVCAGIVASSQGYGLMKGKSSSGSGNSDNDSGDNSTRRILEVLVAKCYLYLLTLLATFMWVSHTFLSLANATTLEMAKGPEKLEYLKGTRECDLPFSRWVHQNLRLFCCFRDKTWAMLLSTTTGCGGAATAAAVDDSWQPIEWTLPKDIVRDSEDCWKHPWQNKYYSCC